MTTERPRFGGDLTGERHAAETIGGGRLVEQYRALRAIIESKHLESSMERDEGRSLIVLVVGVDHGVSEVGVRLAAAFADSGQPTLVIDADSRAQGRHHLLGPGGQTPSGMADWLLSSEREPPIPAYPSDLPNLTIMPAGSPSCWREGPLANGRLSKLVDALRASRDRVVIIAPPLSQAADALILAPHTDGALLVIAPGKTSGPAAIRARDTLLATGSRCYGIVLGEAESR